MFGEKENGQILYSRITIYSSLLGTAPRRVCLHRQYIILRVPDALSEEHTPLLQLSQLKDCACWFTLKSALPVAN